MIDLSKLNRPLFRLGRLVATPAVVESGEDLSALVDRHVCGDWGLCDSEDWATNDAALAHGRRILSVYRIAGRRAYIITEHDRSQTTILFADEY